MSDLIRLIDDINHLKIKTLNIIETEEIGVFPFIIERMKEVVKHRFGDYEYIRKETIEEVEDESVNLTLFRKPRIITIDTKNLKGDKITERLSEEMQSTFIFIRVFGKVERELLKSIRINHYNLRNITYGEMREVIRQTFEKHSIKVDPSVIDTLMSFYSGNFGEIYNEAKKVIIYCEDKKNLTSEELYRCILGLQTKINFEEVFTLLLESKVEELLEKVERIKREMKKESFIYLMAYIGKHIDHLIRIKEMLRTGKSESEIIKDGSIFLNTYLKRKYIKLSKKFKFNDLYRIYDALRKYDIPLKWGILSPSLQFEKFIFETLEIIK